MPTPAYEPSVFPTVSDVVAEGFDDFQRIVMKNPSFTQLTDKQITTVTGSLLPYSAYYDSFSIDTQQQQSQQPHQPQQQQVAQQAQPLQQVRHVPTADDGSKFAAFQAVLASPFTPAPKVLSTPSNSEQSHTVKKSQLGTASLKGLKKLSSRRSSKRDGRPSPGRRTSPNSRLRCDVCNQLYSRKDNLRAHQRVHNGEKPYKCNECGASFRWLGALRTHQATHKSTCTSSDQNDTPLTQSSSQNCSSDASKSPSIANMPTNTDFAGDFDGTGLATTSQVELLLEQCAIPPNVESTPDVAMYDDISNVVSNAATANTIPNVATANASLNTSRNASTNASAITATTTSMTTNAAAQPMVHESSGFKNNVPSCPSICNNMNNIGNPDNNFGLNYSSVVNSPVNNCDNNLFPYASHASSLNDNIRSFQHSPYVPVPTNDGITDKCEDFFQWDKPDDPFSFNDSFLTDSSVLSELVPDWMPVRAA